MCMFKAARCIFYLLLLSYFSFAAFDAKNFLYDKENATRLNASSFTLDNINYSIVQLDGKPLFLLKNGEPLQTENDIKSVLGAYYKQTTYPSTEELASLKQAILDYNLSRNDGGRFLGKEEYACRQILLLNGIKYGSGYIYCDSDEGCYKVALVLYSASYAKGIKKTISFEDTIALIKEYGKASDETDKLVRNALSLMENINDENLASSLTELKSIVPQLRTHKSTLENTRVRTPTTDPAEVQRCIDEKCFAMCPDISFNGSQLNLLENNANSILSKSAPYVNHKSISFEVYNHTVSRFLFRTSETKAIQFSSLFDPLSVSAGEVSADTSAALNSVSNESLRINLNKINDLTNKINNSIELRNFSTIEQDLADYEEAISETKLLIPKVLQLYNQSLSTKSTANAIIFLLDTKDLSSKDRKRLDELKNVSNNLDASFSKGLTDNELQQLSASYSNVSQQASELLKIQKEGLFQLASSKFRSFARRINSGLASLVSLTKLTSLSDFASNKLFSFGGVAAITFLSLAALSLFVFFGIFAKFRLATGLVKFVLLGGYGIFIIGLLIFSVFLYVFLTKTASAADIEEFIYDINTKKSSAIALELQGVNYDAANNMKSCANMIADSLRANNKSVLIYELGDTCTVKSSSADIVKDKSDCKIELKNTTSFVLAYSAVPEKPALSTIYDTKAFLHGDSAYYKSCTISTLFK